MENNKFENFLIEKNDRVDNAAFELINALVSTSEEENDEEVEWDMEHIGEVVDMVKSYLAEQGFQVCHPYWGEGGTRCVDCGDCFNKKCLLKKEK